MISLSRIVRVGKKIILMLKLSIECSINCISLFNVIFLYCWAHIRSMSLWGAYATNFHLLYISISQRRHKRSKIINFILKVRNTYFIYSFICGVSTGAKLFRVGCHVWYQLACSLRCLIYQCPSTCSINDTTVSRHQSFIEILNEQLIGYSMMRALNTQLLKYFPILGKYLSMRLSNPTYFFAFVGKSRCWEILLKKNLLHGIPRSNRTWENREKPCLCCPFWRERESFQQTCSSSTPFGFMPTQTIWNSLRWVWGSSPARPLNVGSKCIKPNLSSKFTLLSMFMHNSWFSILGAASSLSVCCRATTMVLTLTSFRNLRKVFSISRSTCTWLWLV